MDIGAVFFNTEYDYNLLLYSEMFNNYEYVGSMHCEINFHIEV